MRMRWNMPISSGRCARFAPSRLVLQAAESSQVPWRRVLWDHGAVQAEARERVAWHEQMARSGELTEKQQVHFVGRAGP